MTVLDLPVTLEDRPLPRRVGLVTLATDHTTEVDFAVLPPRAIGVYATRIPFANPVTPETLAAMADDVTRAAALILPDEDLDAVVYSCTSQASRVQNRSRRSRPGSRRCGCLARTGSRC